MRFSLGLRAILLSLPLVIAFVVYSEAQEAPDRFLDAPYGADQKEITDALKRCNHNQITANICAWDSYIKEDRSYRAAAEVVRQAIAAERQAELDRANRAFEQFRNLTCEFDTAGGGSITFSLIYGCRAAYTARRANALRRLADCMKTDACERPNQLWSYENPPPSGLGEGK